MGTQIAFLGRKSCYSSSEDIVILLDPEPAIKRDFSSSLLENMVQTDFLDKGDK